MLDNLYRFGQLAGLGGAQFIFLQIILAARFPWLDRWLGVDRVARLHKWIGLIGLALLLVHAGCLSGYYLQFGSDVFIAFIQPSWKLVTLGMVSLDTIVLFVITALTYRKLRIPYHWWKRTHFILYAAVIGGFVHSFWLGSDLTAGWLRWYWIGLGCAVLIAIIHRRCWIPWRAQRVSVIKHQLLAGNIHHATLSRPDFTYLPGQFIFVQFLAKGITREWHPFTISSSPGDRAITLSMKACGDWTNSLDQLTVGTKATIEGPYGRFSYKTLPTHSLGYVFIAGGIGITPLRSMIRQLVQDEPNRPIILLYSAKTTNDLVFKDELDAILHTTPTHSTYYLTAAEGKIDTNYLSKKITEPTQYHYFICGPKPMMRAMRQSLQELQVPMAQIHTEEFSLN